MTSPLTGNTDKDSKNIALKLHKQFSHPPPHKLKQLVRDSGVEERDILDKIDEVSSECIICKRYKRTPPRPVVGFPLASSFNETVAFDLKFFDGQIVLHMIDHATRYSRACVIPNKGKHTIVKALMEHWIAIFGAPGFFLSDNGGEFVNDEVIELAEQFNITVRTTAAESPWSNGLCEKHNGILADNVHKTMADAHCDLKLALPWSVASKNCLSNVYGYSPNQLVFGHNPTFPNALDNKPPAQRISTSEYIAKNLHALHSARAAFIQQESRERLKRALNRKTRRIPFFGNGDTVYYKRNNSEAWHGPAKVLGRDAQQYLLKHGGVYVRVHPCRMQLLEEGAECSERQPSDVVTPANQQLSQEPSAVADSSSEDEGPQRPSGAALTPPDTPAHDRNLIPHIPHIPVYDLDEEIEQHIPVNPPVVQPDPQHLPGVPAGPDSSLDQLRHHQPRPPLATRRLQDFNTSPDRSSDPHGENFATDDEVSSIEDIFFGDGGVRFDSAKMEELVKWKQMSAYVEVEDIGQDRISSRWVCTEKIKGGNLVMKARLVARGFEENNPQVRTDSPTCQRESLRTVLAILSAQNWDLKSIDVKSAYLQGLPINRDLYLIPPKIAKTKKLWRLLKCPYGISDAGRHWYLKVIKELKTLNMRQLKLDQAVFVWDDPSGALSGVIAIHVDDFIYGGTQSFQDCVISKLRLIFQIGLEESSGMKYLGLMIAQSSSGISISVDSYCQSLAEVSTDLDQAELRKELRHVSGQLNWVASQCRPDLAYDNCVIGNSVNTAEIKDAKVANKAIRKAKGQEVSLHYPSGLNLSTCRIVGFPDASFANLPGRGSQGAFIIFLCDSDGKACVISWQSRKVRRKVNSTLAAECLAAVEAAGACVHLRHVLKDIMNISELKDSDFPISILSDNRSLVDAVHTSTAIQNKWLQIDISVLRDALQSHQVEEFRWVSTELQVANALTKAGCSSDYLLNVLRRQLQYRHSTGAFVYP